MDIVIYPHPSLKRKTKPVTEFDDQLRAKVERMRQLMEGARGVGLAAPQVDWPVRLFLSAPDGDAEQATVYVNPRIEKRFGKKVTAEEGCLSLPGIQCKVKRPEGVLVRAFDLEGQEFVREATELEARIIQHEFDHLEGILIVDKLSPTEKFKVRKTLKELKANYAEAQAAKQESPA